MPKRSSAYVKRYVAVAASGIRRNFVLLVRERGRIGSSSDVPSRYACAVFCM